MTNWQDGDITANGIRLHYVRTGGDKLPVVLAHGLTDNGLCWMRLAQALEHEYDLIMVDARGHGKSESADRGYGSADHAADYAGAIQALGLMRPAMIGHSMGAATSTYLAAHYPGLVRCILLEDPPWRSKHEAAPQEEQIAMAERWRQEVVARKGMRLQAIIAQGREQRPMWPEEEFAEWAESKRQVSPNALDYARYPSKHWTEVVGNIDCPALLLIGDVEHGAIVSPEVAQDVAVLNPRVQVAHIAGAGHSIRREQFDAYLQAISTFLAAFYS